MLERMAQESGIATPTAEDLTRLDRQRRGKTLSNEEWVSETDPEARIPNEGRHDPSGLQARACGGSGHGGGGGR